MIFVVRSMPIGTVVLGYVSDSGNDKLEPAVDTLKDLGVDVSGLLV